MMNKIIIGISGKIGSGKTTFATFLSNNLEKFNLPYRFINFADKLKEITYVLTGKNGYTQEEKQEFLPDWNLTVGQILQKLGTEVMRDNFDKDVWVKSTLSEIRRDDKTQVFIIGDCRFTNEASFIKDCNGILIRINGDPANVRRNSTRDLNHPSETGLDNYNGFDFVFENNLSIDNLIQFSEHIADRINYQLKYKSEIEKNIF